MKHNLCANYWALILFSITLWSSLSFSIRTLFSDCGMHKEASYTIITQFLCYIQRMVYVQTHTYIMILIFLMRLIYKGLEWKQKVSGLEK